MDPEQLIAKYQHLPDLHLTRIMGAWVVISQGNVIEVDRTHVLRRCPLQSMLSDAEIETYAAEKIAEFKQFTPKREVWRADFAVPFGTSEMFMVALRKGTIDCAVTVCDGAGTVVTDVPEVVQGIGARMNGVFYTTSIPEVRDRLRSHHCILLDDARIDQLEGLRKAIEAGFTRIAVTVNGRLGQPLADFRRLENQVDASVTIAAVCTTGVTQERTDEILAGADLAWSCASCRVRDSGTRARLQVTQGIPIFVYTDKGIALLAAYSDESGAEILRSLDPSSQYLLAAAGSSTRILLGELRLALSEVLLPVRSNNEPSPLI
jgi:putative methanogenesis marker protein 8